MKYFICIIAGVLFGFLLFCLLSRYGNTKGRKKKRNSKIKPNFTKAVLIAVLSTYFVGLLIGIKVTLTDFDQFGVLATYIATPTTTVIAMYCWKAKAENMIKMKQEHPEETEGISVDFNNITTSI